MWWPEAMGFMNKLESVVPCSSVSIISQLASVGTLAINNSMIYIRDLRTYKLWRNGILLDQVGLNVPTVIGLSGTLVM